MRIKALDILIIALSAGIVGLSAVWAYGPRADAAKVVIKAQGGEYIYPLSSDREIQVPGPLGVTLVEIKDKAVHIEDSPCPNKTCIAAGSVSEAGQWIACLPNQVLVRIEGDSADAGVDAAVY
jgi:Uncharacterized protein conserved in bacteria